MMVLLIAYHGLIVKMRIQMTRNTTQIFYLVLMVIIVVAVDFLFFRHRFQARLMANIAIVLTFVVFYLLFLKRQ